MKSKELIKYIESEIEEAEEYLKENDTNYEEVLNNEDTDGYDEDGENNNFEAGIIAGLQKVLRKLKEDFKQGEQLENQANQELKED